MKQYIVDDRTGEAGLGMSMRWERWKPSLRQMRSIWRGRVQSSRKMRTRSVRKTEYEDDGE